MASRRSRFVLLPLFFGSGFAALLYQMVWQRLLTLFGGADVYSVTIIVSAFMAGLGFGSLAGGHVADRLSPRGRLAAFALAEAAVAVFAFWSVPLLHDVLYPRLAPLALSRLATALILLAVLLWPTFFMGVSLPLLARATSVEERSPEDWIGALYGVNTLGAALGALLTPWVLVRALGFAGSVRLGVVVNLACAAGGLALALGERPGARGVSPRSAQSPEPAAPQKGFSQWLLLYALSGFVALSLEILWFRILGVVLKSNAFTFSTLLALYLTGVGGGAVLARRPAHRARDPRSAFLLLQSSITLYAATALALLVAGVAHVPALGPVWRYLGEYEALDLGFLLHPFSSGAAPAPVGLFVALYVAVPILLLGPPTLLMGASFTFLQRAAQTDPDLVGRRVGWLQTANILGSTLGTFLTGIALLQLLGTSGTLRLLVVLGGAFLALWARSGGIATRSRRLVASAAVVAVAAALVPSSSLLWARLHGGAVDLVISEEDGSGLSVLRTRRGRNPSTAVFVNGLGQSEIPYGGGHTRLGALPVLLHPAPRSVLLIGLGSGDTAFAASGRQATETLDCVEIVEPQLDTLRVLADRRPYLGLRTLLRDGRVRYTFTDGRAFMARRAARYDVIEADALRPTSAYSGNLYSREYFELVRSRLAPGGFGVTWAPTPRILATFRSVFPHVLRFDDILIGSDRPISHDRAALEARLADPFTRDLYARGAVDVRAQLAPLLARPPVAYDGRVDPADPNTDVFPRDEFQVP
jgi:spermidine synthase